MNGLFLPKIKRRSARRQNKEANKLSLSPEDFIKDLYVLEFLNIPSDSDFVEKDIENVIIQKIQQFLLEMGRDFPLLHNKGVSQQKMIIFMLTLFFIIIF